MKNVGEYDDVYCIIDYMQLIDCQETLKLA